jgi:hypothetical protein
MQTVTITCTRCGKASDAKPDKKGEAKLPRGWKRHSGVWCPACWSSAYMMRAVTIPVAGPVSCEWPEFRELLRAAWGESTRLANWCATQYYARDIRRESGMEKLPPPPKVYLYPEARKVCPTLVPTTVTAIDHAVQGKYRAARYKLLWTNEVSLPTFRYPYPLPLPSDNFRLRIGEGDELLCDLRLTSETTDRVTVRLRGGADYRRQRAALEKCIDGAAIPVEATLYRIDSHQGDHRNGVTRTSRVMLKIAAWLPRRESTASSKERFFSVRTDQQSFLYGVLQDREQPWVLNADRMRDWVHQHQRDLRRLGEDRKQEDRRDRNKRRRHRRTLSEKSKKFLNRMDSFVKETAAGIVHFARRAKVTRIKYDDSYRDYVDSFPWAKLRTQLAQKCDEFGIVFEAARGEETTKAQPPLACAASVGDET